MPETTATVHDLAEREYRYGFVTEVDQDTLPPGLDEGMVRAISARKGEPEWLLEWRLKAFRHWLEMNEPRWPNVHYQPIDYQAISYYSAPRRRHPRQPRRGRPRDPAHLREAGHPARGAEAPGRGGGRRGVRQRFGGNHLQEQAGRAGHHLLLVLGGGARTTRSWSAATWARWSPTPTTSSPPSTRRSSPTGRSSTSRRACAARWSCPPTSASTPPTPASSSAP